MIKFSMGNREFYLPKERGILINQVCTNAVSMISQRLTIENTGLSLIDLPYCDTDEADLIEGFIPRAKEGFALSMKPDWLYPSELKKATKTATPFTAYFPWLNLHLKEKEYTLPEWWHVLATIAYLSNLGRVSFSDFSDNPISDYHISLLESDWMIGDLSPEIHWFMMDEIETLTRAALFDEENMGNTKLVKIGHFFAAGKEISKIFEI